MKIKSDIDLDSDSNDFGFSFESEEQQNRHKSLEEEIVDLKQRLQSVRNVMLPLLINLSKDPDKPMIRWPDRHKILKEQIRILEDLTRT